MKYDPTGLRTTMTTSNKEWEKSLKVLCAMYSMTSVFDGLCKALWNVGGDCDFFGCPVFTMRYLKPIAVEA